MSDYTKQTDEQLICALRSGDEAITDYIMEKYKNMVRHKAKAMYLLGGENDDLIQEGMIGLFKAVRDYDPAQEASFASFADLCVSRQLYSAIVASRRQKHMPLNSYVSIYDASAVEAAGNNKMLVEMIEDSNESNPEELLVNKEYARQIEERLRERLSTLEKQVLQMYLQGMDPAGIAEETGKSPKSVSNTLQRIRTKARSLLENNGI